MLSYKTFLLFLIGLIAVTLASLFPALSWLSPLTYMIIFPITAIWFWKSEGRSLRDLGFRFDQAWLQKLAIGLVFGLAIPILFMGIQVIGGWISLGIRSDPVNGLASYLPILLLKMALTV